MNINRHNYESFALDYLEGRLTPVEMADFMAFMTENPDIALELELLNTPIDSGVHPDAHIDFSFLKKEITELPVNENTFEEYCIAWYEGDLTPEYAERLEAYINLNRGKRKIFNAYGRLKLQPDNSISFRGKSSLKKQGTLITHRRNIVITTLSAAATVAIILLLVNPKEQKTQQIAEINSASITSKPFRNSSIQSEIPTIHLKESKEPENSSSIVEYQPQNLAIVDTNNPPFTDIVEIKRIEAKPIDNTIALADKIRTLNAFKSTISQESMLIGKIKTKGSEIYLKATTLTIDQLISSSVYGFNRMTETNLQYQSKSDKKGNIIEYALSSESFNFKRKIGRN